MTDKDYLKTLAKGLGIKDIKTLSVIMGPDELKKTLSGLTFADFDDGLRLITLHNHTTASDGQVTPEKYMDNALAFKEKYGYKDLIVAITDHDTLAGLIPALKSVQKNPDKYKGIRLVLGCELSVSYFDNRTRRPVDFELLHYGINPFDKGYQKWFLTLRHNRQKILPRIFEFFQKKYPYAGIDLTEFLAQHPLMAEGFGCYLAYITPEYITGKVNDASQNEFIWDYFRRFGSPFAEEKDIPFWHMLDEVLQTLKKHTFGFLSVAHPYRISLDGKINESGPDFIKYLFSVLKEKGIEGLEIFYMNLRQPLSRSLDYMIQGYQPISDTDYWVKTILDYADQNQMIKTGGTDSHSDFLAGRKRQIVLKLTDKLKKYKPLIREGYQVLNKEVTLGLPAPCMPPASRYQDTGIGSDCGEGAKRIADFFGGIFDKIQLGPMGRTMKEAKHSPYVSDLAPNPFLIPLEKLQQKGWLSEKTLKKIYDIPKKDGYIDFDIVEQVYDKSLHEAYHNSRFKKSFDDFIIFLADDCRQDLPAKYIADLQVRIPPDAKGMKKELMLSGFSLGSPADSFSSSARNWHFSVFDPKKTFNPDGTLGPAGRVWSDLVDKALQNAAGGLRVDHYIGFVNPFVISDENSENNGRLFSSPDHPELGSYAKSDFTDITRNILLKNLEKRGLSVRDLYVEDIGARPPQLDDVMRSCGLGRLLVAEFLEPSDWNHMYRLSQANPQDVAVLDTHDTPSVQMFFDSLSEDKKAQFSWLLSTDLRFNYSDDLRQTKNLVRMMWGTLMASPAERVQAFFTSWTGQIGRYNQPGNPVKWHLRCVADFETLYFKNLAQGMAYNPFDAIALAIYARGDEFYRDHADLVQRLRAAEEEILHLACDL